MADTPTSSKPTHSTSALQSPLDHLRTRVADVEALPQLTLLGLLTGLLAAGVIIAFRLLAEVPLEHWLGGNSEHFEHLSTAERFILPLSGALLIATLYHACHPSSLGVSVTHVLDRLHNHQGYLPIKNAMVQFFAGALCLLSGQSVGREGPAVHLGAASGSLLGQWLQLPNNSLRPLIACGVAAAIAASFNTPIAGVIFAMEVILMEYTIAGFIPVMLASVVGASVTQLVFGSQPIAEFDNTSFSGLIDVPVLFTVGVVIGAMAAFYVRLQAMCQRFQSRPAVVRFLVAGLITGTAAVWLPEIMGIGYDTVGLAQTGQIAVHTLLLIVGVKLVVTAISLGLGLPGGVIGPTLFLGACMGAAIGGITEWLLPGQQNAIATYALIGMAAMMAAALNAPLAALMAALELTNNPDIIFPSMAVIVIACLVTRHLFRCRSVFELQLQNKGIELSTHPAQQALAKVGVRHAMHRQFATVDASLTRAQADYVLQQQPEWLLFSPKDSSEHNRKYLMPAAALANHLAHIDYEQNYTSKVETVNASASLNTPEQTPAQAPPEGSILLTELAATRYELMPLSLRASMWEAKVALQQQPLDGVYLVNSVEQPNTLPMGVLLNEHINTYYRF